MDNQEARGILANLEADYRDLDPLVLTNDSIQIVNKRIEALGVAISALQAQDVPDANVGKIDKYGYIGIETLLNFCDNSKYHAVAVTPNDFMRMKRVRMPEICEDAVSRKAAVEEIRRYGVGSFDFEDYTPEQAERFVIKLLQNLPSVTPEPCEDAVSRKAVYEAMIEKGQRSRRYRLGETWELNGAEIRETLDTVPPVTPKRKTGKWIEHSFSEDGKTRLIECSECGAAYMVNCLCDYSIFVEERRYCNKCGAKMDGFRLTFVEEQNCEGHVACSVVYSDVMEGALLELPSAQPESNCLGCKHAGMWKDEVEYGYPSPCTRCKRRANDNYEQ